MNLAKQIVLVWVVFIRMSYSKLLAVCSVHIQGQGQEMLWIFKIVSIQWCGGRKNILKTRQIKLSKLCVYIKYLYLYKYY